MALWGELSVSLADMEHSILRATALLVVLIASAAASADSSSAPSSPCVAWTDSNSSRRCTSRRDFYACRYNSHDCPPAATVSAGADAECSLVNGSCAFVSPASLLPNCTVWLGVCEHLHRCAYKTLAR